MQMYKHLICEYLVIPLYAALFRFKSKVGIAKFSISRNMLSPDEIGDKFLLPCITIVVPPIQIPVNPVVHRNQVRHIIVNRLLSLSITVMNYLDPYFIKYCHHKLFLISSFIFLGNTL